jgi:hypothetical protein
VYNDPTVEAQGPTEAQGPGDAAAGVPGVDGALARLEQHGQLLDGHQRRQRERLGGTHGARTVFMGDRRSTVRRDRASRTARYIIRKRICGGALPGRPPVSCRTKICLHHSHLPGEPRSLLLANTEADADADHHAHVRRPRRRRRGPGSDRRCPCGAVHSGPGGAGRSASASPRGRARGPARWSRFAMAFTSGLSARMRRPARGRGRR